MLPAPRSKRTRQINQGEGLGQGWVAGAYVHGSQCGVTRFTQTHPHFVKYVNEFMRQKVNARWSSFVVMRDVCTRIHKDVHNRKDGDSITVTFGNFTGGQLWLQLASDESSEQDGVVWKQDEKDVWRPGKLVSTYERPLEFSPHMEHATHEWAGERWCLSMYTIRETAQVSHEIGRALRRLHFPWNQAMTSRTFGVDSSVALMSSQDREPQQSSEDMREKHDAQTPQQHLKESESDSSPSREEPCQPHVHAGAEEERGVRDGDCTALQGIGRGLEGSHGGQAPGDLDSSQAPKDCCAVTGELEEVRLGESQDVVCQQSGRRPRNGRRWPLDSVEEIPTHPRDRLVGDGCARANEGRGHGGRTPAPSLWPLRHTDGSWDKQGDKGRLLGMPSLPGVPRDASPDEWRHGDSSGPKGASRIQEREGCHSRICQEHGRATKQTQATKWHDWGGAIVRRIMGTNQCGRDHRERGESSSHQHQPDNRGDGIDQEGARREVRGQAGEGRRLSESGNEMPDGEHQRPPVLSPKEISDRVKEGQGRRARLKKGVMRRLLGNARSVMAGVFVTTAAMLGAASEIPAMSLIRPDVVEIHEGKAVMSQAFSQWGWNANQPVRIGDSYRDRQGREELLTWIEERRPRLVILSSWCPKEWREKIGERHRHWRERREALAGFVEDMCDMQMKRGDQVLVHVDPRCEWEQKSIVNMLIQHPKIQHANIPWDHKGRCVDQCHMWATSCESIAHELKRFESGEFSQAKYLVPANEQRERTKVGCNRVFTSALCKGYIEYLKHAEPGRVRKLLRSLAVRIRNRSQQGDATVRHLRWSEKQVLKALRKWSAVYAQGEQDGDSDEEMIPDLQCDRLDSIRSGDEEQSAPPAERVRDKLGTDGISFEVPPGRQLNGEIRRGIAKAHCNLGHPSQSDLARFMKLGGAKQEAIEAVGWLRCITCAHSRKPSTHRVSSIPPCQVIFGDEVQLDCICVHDAGKEAHWFLSVLDRATSYHMLEMLRDHSPAELQRAFDRSWMKWAGPPLKVTVDMEGGFQGQEFWNRVCSSGASISSIAGTAHWQAGKVERHNQTVKDMMHSVIRHGHVKGREDMRRMSREVTWAKNSLVREHGWSPVALVFGREPRVFGEMHHQGNPAAFHPSVGDQDSELAKRMRYRYHAKMEYVKSQARQMLLKTAHHRTRRIPIPKIGQLVFFWRAENHKKRDNQSKWIGPGYIVGLQGGNAWVSCSGRCFLVAGEHLREAVGDEKHFGDPEMQKQMALFKKLPKEATYEDLVGQENPPNEPNMMENCELAQDSTQDMEIEHDAPGEIGEEYRRMSTRVGWHVDAFANPVLVSHRVWAFRTPDPRYPGERFPFRTSWGYRQGRWICFEREVKWRELEDHHQFVPEGPVAGMVTIFQSRTRRESCVDDVPATLKRRKGEPVANQVNAVYQQKTTSKNKLKRMMEKEVPYDAIPQSQHGLYQEAEEKEWKSWLDYDSCEILSPEESKKIEETRPERILPSRYVFRNKNAGLKDPQGNDLPVRAKARLCIQGHLCPDSRNGQVQVDSPTIERVSTMIFLHLVTSLKWTSNWYIGDISNAFLQGAPLTGKPDMFMRQPKQGLKGLLPGQLLKLLKPVYGRPDAPRAWYNELSRILCEELGFQKCMVDPAMFVKRDADGKMRALMIIHVDDLMICHDGSSQGLETVSKLRGRFPFGTWSQICKEQAGVSYCGKEIKVVEREGETCVCLSQRAFVEGKIQTIKLDSQRSRDWDLSANPEEKTDFRSVVGSLQWLVTQTRPDLAFECNQLQKRIGDLRMRDLHRANKAVREVCKNHFELLFKPLGWDAELIVYHDAGLYSSLGVELDERHAEDILQHGGEKKLVYSQKGACLGFVKKGSTDYEDRVHCNLIDWKSATNRRVIESSFAAETHGAIMGHNMARFAQVLLSEIRFGSEVISAIDDEGWQGLCPVTMVTDCKSIYDTVHKDGQHVSEKGSIVHAVLLRQLLSTRRDAGKARLLWVPTRCQLADGLTKAGRGHDLREQLGLGLLFHEKALKKSKPRTGQREVYTGVNVSEKA